MLWNILESEIKEKLTWTWSWPELSLGDLWIWSERLWNVLECSRMLRKVLWVVVVVVCCNYSIISGPDLSEFEIEFELERSSETSRDELELVWTRA